MGVGKTNKRLGNKAEVYYRNVFRALGFDFCDTSRLASKKHDNAKIDLMYIPFNLQIKAGNQTNMNPGKELFMMYTSMQAMFPKEDEVFSKPCLLVHYKRGVRGTPRAEEQEMVYMSMLQFDIFRSKSPDLEYSGMKTFKFDLNSEFKTIVSMTFEVFKEKVILRHYTNVIHNTAGAD